MEIHSVTDDDGGVSSPDWLVRSEAVHRQLRPGLPEDYAVRMRKIFTQGGRMCVAARGERVLGLAVYRIYENTFDGKKMYVDDLVADEGERSTGVGRSLLDHLKARAVALDCTFLTLDSGTQRHRAHAFYFREGMSIAAFAFRMRL